MVKRQQPHGGHDWFPKRSRLGHARSKSPDGTSSVRQVMCRPESIARRAKGSQACIMGGLSQRRDYRQSGTAGQLKRHLKADALHMSFWLGKLTKLVGLRSSLWITRRTVLHWQLDRVVSNASLTSRVHMQSGVRDTVRSVPRCL